MVVVFKNLTLLNKGVQTISFIALVALGTEKVTKSSFKWPPT